MSATPRLSLFSPRLPPGRKSFLNSTLPNGFYTSRNHSNDNRRISKVNLTVLPIPNVLSRNGSMVSVESKTLQPIKANKQHQCNELPEPRQRRATLCRRATRLT